LHLILEFSSSFTPLLTLIGLLQNENLKKQLMELGYKPRKKILTPSQVKLIVDFFGEL